MNRDKRILYVSSTAILALLLLSLFVKIGSSRIVAACLLAPCAAAVWFLIKKRSTLSIQKKEVLLISAVIGVIYTILLQMTGAWFGYYENPYFIGLDVLLTRIIPLTVISISVEIIRSILLAQKSKYVSVVTFLFCILADVLAFSTLTDITSFNRFMDLVGMTLLPSISANFYYHHVSKKYGALPNIAFRLIMALPTYFMPKVAAIPDVLSSSAKLMLPIMMLALVSTLFAKKKKNAIRAGEKLTAVGLVLSIAVFTLMAMLISCQFKYGVLVIATESMTGEINKGDAIIYERYDGQPIKEGQVIVFEQYETKIVHRVVRIEQIGGETRYYTKGDANLENDLGYRTKADIVGLTDLKIAYAGFPSLWLRELLPSS